MDCIYGIRITKIKAILVQSGFGADPDTGAPTAPDKVWKEYIMAHPEAKYFYIL
jgi:hypothetical protein